MIWRSKETQETTRGSNNKQMQSIEIVVSGLISSSVCSLQLQHRTDALLCAYSFSNQNDHDGISEFSK